MTETPLGLHRPTCGELSPRRLDLLLLRHLRPSSLGWPCSPLLQNCDNGSLASPSQEHSNNSDDDDDDDSPYEGGWDVGTECRDNMTPTGDGAGLVTADFMLLDQLGEEF